MEIISGVCNTPGVGMLRSVDESLVYMNPSAQVLFKFNAPKDVLGYSRSKLFADFENDQVAASEEITGNSHHYVTVFKTYRNTYFRGVLCSTKKIMNEHVIRDELVLFLSSAEHVLQASFADEGGLKQHQFIPGASADLRSPISTLFMLIRQMRNQSASRDNDNYLDEMSASLTLLQSQVNEFAAVRENSDKMVTQERVDLERIIAGIHEQLEKHENYKRVTLTITSKGEATFYSDALKIKAALVPVLTNAYDYSDRAKSHSFISLHLLYLSSKVIIQVTDNGIGIPEEHQPNIFQLFYRATAISRGPGIGLYMAREALNRIKGTIHIVSEDKKGSCVTITIPNLGEHL